MNLSTTASSEESVQHLASPEEEHIDEEEQQPARLDIENFCNDVLERLSPRECPLGAMTVEQWENAITALAYIPRLFALDEAIPSGEDDNDQEETHQKQQETTEEEAASSLFTMAHVDTAHRLATRLFQEHSTQSKASRKWTETLKECQFTLVQSWIDTSYHPHKYPDTLHIALDRAEQLWKPAHKEVATGLIDTPPRSSEL